jgi:CheY-like chemotaxis protein
LPNALEGSQRSSMTARNINTPVNKKILIISDSVDEVDDIQALLAEEFGRLLKTDKETEGIQLLIKYRPSVLILAFQEIKQTERFYLSIFRHDSPAYKIPHNTLLLCKTNESKYAYQLCKSGLFDDFVADRPLYDPFRLRLSVELALNSRSQKQNFNQLNNQIEKTATDLHQLDFFISKNIVSGTGQNEKAAQSFQHFVQKLAMDLEQLENNVSSTTDIDMQTMNKIKLSHHFDQFRKKSLQKRSFIVEEQLKKTGAWLKEVSSGYKNQIETTLENSQPIHEIHLMLVDDDEFYLETLTAMLQDAGIQVVGIRDGNTALAKLEYMQPDLILLDYQMPGIDGIETLKQIKLNQNTQSIPVIMLTAVSEREIVNQSLRTGATDYIVKPGDRSAILSKIDAAIKK